MESTYPPALVVHPHVHAGEDEMFYLLGGELTGPSQLDRQIAAHGKFASD